MKRSRLTRLCLYIMVALSAASFASCSEEDSTWNPYYNWQSRNEQWFREITDSAVTAINKAKAEYGDAWEDHCEWRRYKSLMKSQTYDAGDPNDSICVHIIKRGMRNEGVTISPFYNDTVRINFRGFLMNTTFKEDDGTPYEDMKVFSQSYYGSFNAETAAPTLMSVSNTVEGFSTALQHMIPGDDWNVYVPRQMAYGAKKNDEIPAYSTLLFRINLVAVYRNGSGVPEWK